MPQQVLDAFCFFMVKCPEKLDPEALPATADPALNFQIFRGSEMDWYLTFPAEASKNADPFMLHLFQVTGLLSYHSFTEFHAQWMHASARTSGHRYRLTSDTFRRQELGSSPTAITWRVRDHLRKSRPPKNPIPRPGLPGELAFIDSSELDPERM